MDFADDGLAELATEGRPLSGRCWTAKGWRSDCVGANRSEYDRGEGRATISGLERGMGHDAEEPSGVDRRANPARDVDLDRVGGVCVAHCVCKPGEPAVVAIRVAAEGDRDSEF